VHRRKTTSTKVRMLPRMQKMLGEACSATDHIVKGLDAVEKKLGQSSGHAVDTNKMRSTNEKIVSFQGCDQ
jgi:hypothetical protein